MKALSWKEPYGSLMLHGKIETRTWHTNVRGPVLICCSQKDYPWNVVWDISGEEQFERILTLIKEGKLISNPGFAIAIGTLIGCRRMIQDDEDRCFVRFHPDLWCHIYENVIALPQPFVVKGKQGFFNGPDIHDGINIYDWYTEQIKKL